MKVELKLPFEEAASRVELFIRIVYSIVFAIVVGILGMIAGICYGVQWLVILILGKRMEVLNKFIAAYVKYYTSWVPYLCLLTDERPEIMPKF